MFFLEAAPSLEQLSITVWDHECQRNSQRSHYYEKTYIKWEPSTHDFKHNNLARLTIHGFRSDDNFTKYVRRILKTAGEHQRGISSRQKDLWTLHWQIGRSGDQDPFVKISTNGRGKGFIEEKDYRGVGDNFSWCDSLPSRFPLFTLTHGGIIMIYAMVLYICG